MREEIGNTIRHWCRRALIASFILCSGAANAAVISAGSPTTTVPTHLTDGSYPFGITVSLGADQFLLPVQITGAAGLQNWQFDITFDKAVVEEVDPSDGTAGIYGAVFAPGDASSLSFILGGLPLNSSGLVDDVAGSYPSLLSGPTGDGVLAYILFQYLPGQSGGNPAFGVENPVIQQLQVPEPATMALLAAALLTLAASRRWFSARPPPH